MSQNIVTSNNSSINEILELYINYTKLLKKTSLSETSKINMNIKLSIFNDNLESIKDNIYDLIKDLDSCLLPHHLKSKIELSAKTNEVCKAFYPLILLQILQDC